MTDTSDTSVSLYANHPVLGSRWFVVLVGLLLGTSFFVGLGDEPHFVDESAYVSQAYFGDLLLTGDTNSPLWFEYPGFDLPPFNKYLVWFGLVAGGDARPGPAAMRAWYADTSKRFETPASLEHARRPIAFCGMVCVIATGLIARRWRGPVAALVAMLLLTIHPLFRTHARRAMADIPTEMGVVLALLAFLPVAGKIRWRAVIFGGLAAGVAASSKLNGLLAGIVLLVWGVAGLRGGAWQNMLKVVAAGVVGALLFIALNPFIYGQPRGLGDNATKTFGGQGVVERLQYMLEHRVNVSAEGQKLFPHDALTTFGDKAKALLVQGFGRFSPFGPVRDDSRVRFEWRQDWPVLVWLPMVVLGAWVAWTDRNQQAIGRRVFAYWISAIAVVGAFLPLAWNRYYLPLVIPSILLAAGGTEWEIGRFVARRVEKKN